LGHFAQLCASLRRHSAGTRFAQAARITDVHEVQAMWNWISCYVTGHDYSVCCNQGRMFLRCLVCGRRSEGWVVHPQPAHQGHVHAHD
jgi:hypothetical protein